MKLYAECDYQSGCFHHRVHLPFRHLSQDFQQHEWHLSHIDPDKSFDVAFLYGCLKSFNLPTFMRWRREGKKFVFGLDDLIWQFPEWRTDSCPDECVAMVDALCEISDVLVASTPALVDPMRFPEKTVVARNLLEIDAYGLPTPPADDERLRILWSGAISHKGDLQIIDPVCHEILTQYKGKVEFVFFGAGPDKTLRDWWGKGAKLIAWQPLEMYWRTLNYFKPHIVLAPLVDCPFNAAKSSIRCIEAHAMNAALVYSPVSEYALANEAGTTGLPATSTEEWVDCVKRLIDDRELREYVAVSGHRKAKVEYDWNSEQARKTHWHPTVKAIETLVA